jgi:hypothetical protein
MFGKHLMAGFLFSAFFGFGCDGPHKPAPQAPIEPDSGLGGGVLGGGSLNDPFSPGFLPLEPPSALNPPQELNPQLPIQAVEIAPTPVQVLPVDR